MNKNITAMVFTLNEANRIPLVYQNLKGFCNIVVYDGGSTDGTEEFCREVGLKFVKRPKDDSEMGINNLKWVHANTPTDYVIHVFAAHFYPRQLLNTFAEVADQNKLKAVYNDVVIYRYGDVVHRPIARRISSVCVFYKKEAVNFKNSKIHDEYAITFEKSSMVRLPGRDELSLHLFQNEDCESFTRKTISYEALEARQRFRAGERMNGTKLALGPIGRFCYQYIRTGAFTRGSKGLVYSILNMIYDFNTCIILWELSRGLTLENAVKKNCEKRTKLLTKL